MLRPIRSLVPQFAILRLLFWKSLLISIIFWGFGLGCNYVWVTMCHRCVWGGHLYRDWWRHQRNLAGTRSSPRPRRGSFPRSWVSSRSRWGTVWRESRGFLMISQDQRNLQTNITSGALQRQTLGPLLIRRNRELGIVFVLYIVFLKNFVTFYMSIDQLAWF